MHRKSRQRHYSPSARSAGENNLHIGRLMDTFIGSTDRERGIEGERERKMEREKKWGCNGPKPMQANGPVHVAKQDSSVSDNT